METKGLLFGSTSLERTGHVFLTVGIINLLMSSAAWRGWSILRGDASNNAPLSKRDSGEVARDEYSLDHERPSARFMVTIASLGIVAFSIGLVLLLLYSGSRSSAGSVTCSGLTGTQAAKGQVINPPTANAHRWAENKSA